MTENDNAIELYTNKLISIFSIASGVIFGTVLQAINYRKVKNNNGLIFTILFGILYTIFQIYISSYVEENFPNFQAKGRSLTFILSEIGATGLFVIREKMLRLKMNIKQNRLFSFDYFNFNLYSNNLCNDKRIIKNLLLITRVSLRAEPNNETPVEPFG